MKKLPLPHQNLVSKIKSWHLDEQLFFVHVMEIFLECYPYNVPSLNIFVSIPHESYIFPTLFPSPSLSPSPFFSPSLFFSVFNLSERSLSKETWGREDIWANCYLEDKFHYSKTFPCKIQLKFATFWTWPLFIKQTILNIFSLEIISLCL